MKKRKIDVHQALSKKIKSTLVSTLFFDRPKITASNNSNINALTFRGEFDKILNNLLIEMIVNPDFLGFL